MAISAFIAGVRGQIRAVYRRVLGPLYSHIDRHDTLIGQLQTQLNQLENASPVVLQAELAKSTAPMVRYLTELERRLQVLEDHKAQPPMETRFCLGPEDHEILSAVLKPGETIWCPFILQQGDMPNGLMLSSLEDANAVILPYDAAEHSSLSELYALVAQCANRAHPPQLMLIGAPNAPQAYDVWDMLFSALAYRALETVNSRLARTTHRTIQHAAHHH